MLKNIFKFLIFFLIVTFIKNYYSSRIEMQLYQNPDYHFSILIPKNFSSRNPFANTSGTIIGLMDERSNNVQICVKEPFSTYDTEENMLNDTFANTKNFITNTLNGTIVNRKISNMPKGHKSLLITTSCILSQNENFNSYHMITIINNKLFYIVYHIQDTDSKKYIKAINDSFCSFQILN